MTRPIIDSYVKDARIELQGDLRDKVEELPEEIEFNPVFAGGGEVAPQKPKAIRPPLPAGHPQTPRTSVAAPQSDPYGSGPLLNDFPASRQD